MNDEAVKILIPSENISADLALLRDSADDFGRLCGAIKASEHLIKQYKAQAFIEATGTVAEREAKAQLDQRVARAQGDNENAEADFKTLWAKRKAAEIEIEAWRTWSASNRAQMV